MASTSGLMSLSDDRAKAIRQKAGDFTMNLVKALLQTGLYSADHPMAKAVVEDLYGQYQAVTTEAFELSYILLSSVDEHGVMIDGLLPEPIEVAKAFRGVMGDHFLAKFHDYFMRNRIASFTIKRSIEHAEFEAFVALWVSWAVRSLDQQSASSVMSDELSYRGILNVTVVGLDEVIGAQRHLPWPLKVALSRLRKDLSRLPILREARPETIARLKSQVIADVIRPITKPEMIRDLILNADIVSEGLKDVSGFEVEDVLIGAVAPKILFLASQVSLDLLDGVDKLAVQGAKSSMVGRDVEEYRATLRRIVAKMLGRLAANDVAEARSLLEAGYRRGLIAMENLPADVRRHINATEMTERFLAAPDAYLRDFDKATDPRTYLKYLNVLGMILPELALQKHGAHIGRTFQILRRHLDDPQPPFVGRSRFIDESLKMFERNGVLDDTLRIALATPKEEREGLEIGIALFGAAAVPGIVNALANAEDLSGRKAACSMLQRVGKPAVPLMVDELRSHRHSWMTVRNLIAVLGDLGAREALPAVSQYAAHPNERVREECLNTLVKILGEGAEKPLIGFLDDKDETVVRRAIHQLGAIHCTAPAFLEKVADTVRIRTRQEDEPHEWLQVACLRALAQYDRVLLPEQPDLEGALTGVLQPPRLKSLLPGRLGIRRKSDDVVQLTIEALGVIGTGKCVPAVTAEMQSPVEAIRRSASEALEKIRDRQTAWVNQRPMKV